MLSSQTADDVSTFTITATTNDPKIAYNVAKAVELYAPDIVKQVTRPSYVSNLYLEDSKTGEYVKMDEDGLQCIKSIRTPKEAVSPASPNLVSNTLLAAIAALVVSYTFFLVRKVFDTVIRGEESAKALINLPIIGKIPSWDTNIKSTTSNNAKEYK